MLHKKEANLGEVIGNCENLHIYYICYTHTHAFVHVHIHKLCPCPQGVHPVEGRRQKWMTGVPNTYHSGEKQ